ncbi:MAG: phenylacetate--CoA ligase family protein [bacterium]|nr:phenylacetate--CoA ligase family protein [bacterium]
MVASDLQSTQDLRAVPPLTKSELRDLGPEPFLTRRLWRSERSQTAGTSGQPVTVIRDSRERGRLLARRWACQSWHGLKPGDREARFWGRSESATKNLFLAMAANRRVFTFLDGADNDPAREAVALAKFKPDFLYGYSSLLLRAAEFLCNSEDRPHPKVVICTAESIQESQRRFISQVFACPVILEYGCSEFDIVAYTCPSGRMHVLSPEILLEVDAGEVLVTDLDNHLMPLLRFRLGDMVRLESSPCDCGWRTPIIGEIQGRTIGQILILPSGRETHAVVFAHAFEASTLDGISIRRFQVLQESPRDLRIVLEGDADLDDNAVNERIRAAILDRLPEYMQITIERGVIPTIPGRKFTYFVPLSGD